MNCTTSLHRSMPSDACRRIECVYTRDGAILPIYELIGCHDRPPILFAHGCGFSAGSCLPFLSHLAKHARVFAYDARGHGGAYWPHGPAEVVFSPMRLADDLLTIAKFVSQEARSRPHFVGHSLGAGTALWALTRTRSTPFATLTLLEPNVFPVPSAPERAEAEQKNRQLIHKARARRAEWTSPAELARKLMRAACFSEEAAVIHANATLRRLDERRWRLCCPPAIESAIFENYQDDRLWKLLSTISQRIVLVSADPSRRDREWVTSCMQSVSSLLRNCELRVVPNSTHLLAMTEPKESARIVLTEVDQVAKADRPKGLSSDRASNGKYFDATLDSRLSPMLRRLPDTRTLSCKDNLILIPKETTQANYFRRTTLDVGAAYAMPSLMHCYMSVIFFIGLLAEQSAATGDRCANVFSSDGHLDRLLFYAIQNSSLYESCNSPRDAIREVWEHVTKTSLHAYRSLVEDEKLITFFRQTTPIDVIQWRRIGSRQRSLGNRLTLTDMRAVSWVLGWSQTQFHLPGWYGIGAALDSLRKEQPDAWKDLRKSLANRQFLSGVFRNIEASLLMTDPEVITLYATLVDDHNLRVEMLSRIFAEFELARDQLSTLIGPPVAGRSGTIDMRARGLVWLHREQVRLLRLWRESPDNDTFRALLQTIRVIAIEQKRAPALATVSTVDSMKLSLAGDSSVCLGSAANLSNFSSCSTPPIRPRPRSS